MYDYMKSLQQQFESKPEYIQDLKTEVNQTHKELSARLSKEDRRLLLKLVDLEDALRCEATLHSFVSDTASPAASTMNYPQSRCTPSTERRKNALDK